jgi:hypothetical protein
MAPPGLFNIQKTTVTIANGASLSSAGDLGGTRLVGIIMPAAWTAAALTFQVSYDGGTTFANLYDEYGLEYTVTADAGRAIKVPALDFLIGAQVKVRSGTSGTPANQGAARDLILVSMP